MKLSVAAFYAVCAMTYLARYARKEFLTSHQIAKDLLIPQGFLMRILVTLSNAGILTTLKGPHGGYRIARPAKEISLLEIVEAMDGRIKTSEIHDMHGAAAVNRMLEIVYREITEKVRHRLGRIRFSELISMT